MAPRIPIASPSITTSKIPKPHNIESHGITFSFEIYEKNEYFNLDVTCPNWSSELIDMLQDISKRTKRDLLSHRIGKYRIHSHENASPPCPFPENISPKDCYQIRLGKSKGGIHGIFVDDVFFILWLDPLHNMYPDERYGGLKKISPPSTCCMDRNEEINTLNNTINELREELNLYKELYD